MTCKEVVAAAVECTGPPRVPYTLGIPGREYFDSPGADSQWARIGELAACAPHDIVTLWPSSQWKDAGKDESGQPVIEDLWGIRWVETHGTLRVVSHPLADGIPADYAPPPLPATSEMQGFRETADAHRDRYLLGVVWFTLFEHLWFLRGFEQTLVELYDRTADIERLLTLVFERALACTRQWREIGVDGVFFSDDWGSQRGMIASPKLWREVFRPLYARLFEAVHAQGAHVWMHSCGNVLEILPDLVEIGLDVLNPVQPQAMPIEVLADRFGGKLCFHGGIDVQGTLVRGTPQDVRDEVRRTIETLGAFDGGYVGTTSHSIMPETPPENLIALLEAFQEQSVTPPVRAR